MSPVTKVVDGDERTAEDATQTINVSRMLRYSAWRKPKKAAIICGDQMVSYEALDKSTDALARWLLEEGLRPGDRVLMHCCNWVELVSLHSPASKTVIVVPVSPRLKAPEIGYMSRGRTKTPRR